MNKLTIFLIAGLLLIGAWYSGFLTIVDYDVDGVPGVDADDMKFCVANDLDCDLKGMMRQIRPFSTFSITDSCSAEDLMALDVDNDCIISDSELLNAIDLWATNSLSNVCLLLTIDGWAGVDIDIEGCNGVTTTTTTLLLGYNLRCYEECIVQDYDDGGCFLSTEQPSNSQIIGLYCPLEDGWSVNCYCITEYTLMEKIIMFFENLWASIFGG